MSSCLSDKMLMLFFASLPYLFVFSYGYAVFKVLTERPVQHPDWLFHLPLSVLNWSELALASSTLNWIVFTPSLDSWR